MNNMTNFNFNTIVTIKIYIFLTKKIEKITLEQ